MDFALPLLIALGIFGAAFLSDGSDGPAIEEPPVDPEPPTPGGGQVGTDGDDDVILTSGDDSFSGGLGNDFITALAGNDLIFGGEGGDSFDGNLGDDKIFGNEGYDTLAGELGDDEIRGGTGFDDMYGGTGDDSMAGGRGKDLMVGGSGDDLMKGGAWNDGLFGGEGDDDLRGETSNDLVIGGAGNDMLRGGDEKDIVFGGTGSDVVAGGNGNDIIAGSDLFVTELDEDDYEQILRDGAPKTDSEGNPLFDGLTLSGTDTDLGADTLFGGNGSDTIYIGNNDIATGGSGPDEFIVGDWIDAASNSEITDFNAASDVIVVSLAETNADAVIAVVDNGDDSQSITIDGDVVVTVQGPVDPAVNLADDLVIQTYAAPAV